MKTRKIHGMKKELTDKEIILLDIGCHDEESTGDGNNRNRKPARTVLKNSC
jgi:hypothetical protein